MLARHDAAELGGVEERRLGLLDVPRRRLARRERPHHVARPRERLLLVVRVVVGDAARARVDVGPAEVLRAHLLAGRGLHERRAAEEDRPATLHDDRLVAHRRHVGAAGRARAEHHADLRDPGGAHAGLVVEDPAEVVAVGEHLGLQREEGAARVHEVDAGQRVLEGDLLRPQVLLHREREVRPALHGRVVRDDHHLAAAHAADPADEARGGGLAAVEAAGGEGADLEERRARVEEPLEPLAHEALSLLAVARGRLGPAARARLGEPLAQIGDEPVHVRRVLAELRRGDVDARLEDGQGAQSPRQIPSSRAVSTVSQSSGTVFMRSVASASGT